MNFEDIKFPIEGNVQNLVHFSDSQHNYAFSFASPFMYEQPAELKLKKAFLLGSYNPFYPGTQTPEKIFTYYLTPDKKERNPVKNLNADQKNVVFMNGDGLQIGSMNILSPHNRLLKFDGMIPNLIYDAEGNVAGFCHYQPSLRRKCVYSFQPSFEMLNENLQIDKLRENENSGAVKCHFTYEIIHKDSDTKKKLEAMFSAEKKAEMINNRINMIQKPESNERAELFITALVAFFWNTLIDLPLMEK